MSEGFIHDDPEFDLLIGVVSDLTAVAILEEHQQGPPPEAPSNGGNYPDTGGRRRMPKMTVYQPSSAVQSSVSK
jgi:hypothetical protein